jgi:hypothetical protein
MKKKEDKQYPKRNIIKKQRVMSENEIYCSVNAKRSQQLIVYSLLPFDGIIVYKKKWRN